MTKGFLAKVMLYLNLAKALRRKGDVVPESTRARSGTEGRLL